MRRAVLTGLAVLFAGPVNAADLVNGRLLFAQCGICHALTHESSSGKQGPLLAGLFGRKAGTVMGYKYSMAMRSTGVIWSETTLDAYLKKPSAFVPGTKMIYGGLRRASDRRDLIAYLRKILD